MQCNCSWLQRDESAFNNKQLHYNFVHVSFQLNFRLIFFFFFLFRTFSKLQIVHTETIHVCQNVKAVKIVLPFLVQKKNCSSTIAAKATFWFGYLCVLCIQYVPFDFESCIIIIIFWKSWSFSSCNFQTNVHNTNYIE